MEHPTSLHLRGKDTCSGAAIQVEWMTELTYNPEEPCSSKFVGKQLAHPEVNFRVHRNTLKKVLIEYSLFSEYLSHLSEMNISWNNVFLQKHQILLLCSGRCFVSKKTSVEIATEDCIMGSTAMTLLMATMVAMTRQWGQHLEWIGPLFKYGKMIEQGLGNRRGNTGPAGVSGINWDSINWGCGIFKNVSNQLLL